MTGECARMLEQSTVTRVWIDDELGVWQMLGESEGIDGGNHDVVVPVRDEHRLRDLLQISVVLASGPGPGSHRYELGSGSLRCSRSILIFRPPCEPPHELASG